MSPSSYATTFCDQSGMFTSANGGCQGHQGTGTSPMFPSMSVNVSMNMTMHGYPPPYPDSIQHQVTCPQVRPPKNLPSKFKIFENINNFADAMEYITSKHIPSLPQPRSRWNFKPKLSSHIFIHRRFPCPKRRITINNLKLFIIQTSIKQKLLHTISEFTTPAT